MALKEELTKEPQEEGQDATLSESEERDLSIAVNLAKNMIDDGGHEVITQAQKTKDPGQIIGQFLFQMVPQMVEQLSGKIDLSPAIFLAQGGWVEQVSDYLQEEYNVPKDVMDRAEIYVATKAHQMAQQKQQGAGQQEQAPAEAQAAPAMPQQGGGMM